MTVSHRQESVPYPDVQRMIPEASIRTDAQILRMEAVNAIVKVLRSSLRDPEKSVMLDKSTPGL
jgi:hypothetical protein